MNNPESPDAVFELQPISLGVTRFTIDLLLGSMTKIIISGYGAISDISSFSIFASTFPCQNLIWSYTTDSTTCELRKFTGTAALGELYNIVFPSPVASPGIGWAQSTAGPSSPKATVVGDYFISPHADGLLRVTKISTQTVIRSIRVPQVFDDKNLFPAGVGASAVKIVSCSGVPFLSFYYGSESGSSIYASWGMENLLTGNREQYRKFYNHSILSTGPSDEGYDNAYTIVGGDVDDDPQTYMGCFDGIYVSKSTELRDYAVNFGSASGTSSRIKNLRSIFRGMYFAPGDNLLLSKDLNFPLDPIWKSAAIFTPLSSATESYYIGLTRKIYYVDPATRNIITLDDMLPNDNYYQTQIVGNSIGIFRTYDTIISQTVDEVVVESSSVLFVPTKPDSNYRVNNYIRIV